jgi:hypothetical protein
MKETMNFNIQPPSMFVFIFGFLQQNIKLKLACSLDIYQYTTFHGRMLTVASFAFTSEV